MHAHPGEFRCQSAAKPNLGLKNSAATQREKCAQLLDKEPVFLRYRETRARQTKNFPVLREVRVRSATATALWHGLDPAEESGLVGEPAKSLLLAPGFLKVHSQPC